jgi:hypothetical protein
MKKELLDALKARFAGVSENVLNRVAERMAKTVTTAEQVASAVEGVTFQQVLDSYGDSRATEAQQTAVKNYESKYGLKDGVKAEGGAATAPPAQTTTPPAAGGDDVPAWAKTLLDTNKALAERLNKFEADRTTATRREQLNGIIGKLPEHLRKPYERTSVDNLNDEQFTALTGEIATEVDAIVKDAQAKGAVFGRPVGGGQQSKATAKEASDEEANSVVDRFNLG